MNDDIMKEIIDFMPTLRTYARSLTFNDPDDLVQTAVMRAIANLHRFKRGTNLKAWLMTILKNATLNEFRRRKTLQNNDAYHARSVSNIAPDNPETTLIIKEIISNIPSLTKVQQKTICLIGLGGMKYDEVAKRTKVSAGTVKSRLSRGREKLRQLSE